MSSTARRCNCLAATSEGNAKQSTFWHLSPQFGELLMEICGRPVPHAKRQLGVAPSPTPTPPPPTPYTPTFVPREVRPEQADFRALMLEVWNHACPISGTRHIRLLEAAHFKDWRFNNDAQAGMLLDVRVHTALDANLLAITLDPRSNMWTVTVQPDGMSELASLDGITFVNRIPT
jgi:hypothetical protein